MDIKKIPYGHIRKIIVISALILILFIFLFPGLWEKFIRFSNTHGIDSAFVFLTPVLLVLLNFISGKQMEKIKSDYTTLIQNAQKEHNKEITKLSGLIERGNFIHKVQFEKEFQIYLELWDELLKFESYISEIQKLYAEKPENDPEIKILIKGFYEIALSFSNTIKKYAPFYDKKIYDSFIKILNSTSEINTASFEINSSEKWENPLSRETITNIYGSLIFEKNDILSCQIRHRIESLKIIE